ncbi:hypothetical protein N6O07_23240, partial [Escherichia coli]|uniref:hypothetical protein n=1 Tax=Escherichia coli TaxID=562 RepID=UPI00234E1F09
MKTHLKHLKTTGILSIFIKANVSTDLKINSQNHLWRSLRAGLSCCASSQASCLAPSGFNP